MTDKQLRLNRIFGRDGRTLIAALDHGIAGLSPLSHLNAPGDLLPQVLENGADAIITTPGIVRSFGHLLGRAGLVLRIDGGPSALGGDWDKMELIMTVEEALRLGADAVIVMAITGAVEEAHSLSSLGRLAARCDGWGLPLVAEVLPGGFAAKTVTLDQMVVSARLAAELGADVVKIRYQGPVEDFKQVTEACFVPVVVLGGSRQLPEQLCSEIQQAVQAGAHGAAVGRNIWQSENPGQITARLAQSIHVK